MDQPDHGSLDDRMAHVLGLTINDEPDISAQDPDPASEPANEPANEPASGPGDDAQPGADGTQAGQDEQAAAEFEFDWQGQKFKLPEALREVAEGALRQADYTRKTQELAEQRRLVESQAKTIQQHVQMQQALSGEMAELATLDRKLAEFAQLDWSAAWDSDPVQAGKLRIARDEIRDAREKLAREISGKQQALVQHQQAQMQQLIQQGHEVLKRDIPQWSATKAQEVAKAMLDYGFSAEEMDSVTDPRAVRVMHDAMQWRQLQSKKPAVMQKAAQAPKTLKPAGGQPSAAQAQREQLRQKAKRTGRMEDFLAAYRKG